MIRVIKVGGSLLLHADLVNGLADWLERQRPARAELVIVGGGEMIDAMRKLHRVHPLDAAEMHWRCVWMLRATYEIVWEQLAASGRDEWSRIETAADFADRLADQAFRGPTLIAVDTFFQRQAKCGLAETWETTTDAIAAVLAKQVGADELVLLKSCDVEPTLSLAQLAEAGIVDSQFPAAAQGLANVRLDRLVSLPTSHEQPSTRHDAPTSTDRQRQDVTQ